MQNFEYYTPTKIVFGKQTEQQVGELIKEQGCQKVLIHYGGNSAKASGLLDRVKASLDNAGIAYTELGGVVANPLLSLVYQGIELCKKEQVDFILAVGGGSVIDSSKAIAYGVAEPDKDVWELYDRKRQATACLPVATILTLAAAGSEMSESSVITKEEGDIKRGYSNNLSRPVFSILNPELTMTLPKYQTASGNVDILMHTMERYFTPHDTMEITDGIAESLLKTVMKNAQILAKDPQNYEARAEIMWSGSLSHNGLTNCGGGNGDWATHMLEHELSGMFGVTHGAGLAAVWGHWARYVYQALLPRFERFALRVMGVAPAENAEQTALKGIEAMENFFRSIDMPTNLSELGVNATAEQITEMAKKCAIASKGCIGAAKPLYEQDMAAIYTAAQNA
ncbi:iron-containing alcohol dehydrogenase [Basfia succiniciproducens]|uniref:Alcohol dehydrogenase iron-type/glycerol dehydrogenase GldA domain-containing protein n=1 Tax=Basfia succiniciproducens TaxID=653940 RepID=A0A1G5AAF0_9PAST|nr:iron-containing alcohol dehydrogenase [Basfia succiniciproducens]QIM68286.1 butanol dehydrogenase [Basfia succiniciproducens]SCX74821.1 hypothetical protein SAMN02910354_00038 [Basfia succiniciproducens]